MNQDSGTPGLGFRAILCLVLLGSHELWRQSSVQALPAEMGLYQVDHVSVEHVLAPSKGPSLLGVTLRPPTLGSVNGVWVQVTWAVSEQKLRGPPLGSATWFAPCHEARGSQAQQMGRTCSPRPKTKETWSRALADQHRAWLWVTRGLPLLETTSL